VVGYADRQRAPRPHRATCRALRSDDAGNVDAPRDLRKREAEAHLDIEHQTYISLATISLYFHLVG